MFATQEGDLVESVEEKSFSIGIDYYEFPIIISQQFHPVHFIDSRAGISFLAPPFLPLILFSFFLCFSSRHS
jgi:hypothetical protein